MTRASEVREPAGLSQPDEIVADPDGTRHDAPQFADLELADLELADLEVADLELADLELADLELADLELADLVAGGAP